MGAERVQRQRQVEPAVEGRPLLLHRLHRPHRRAAEEQLQLRAGADPVPGGAEQARQLGGGLGERRELVEDEQQRPLGGGEGERLEGVFPIGERAGAEVADPSGEERGRARRAPPARPLPGGRHRRGRRRAGRRRSAGSARSCRPAVGPRRSRSTPAARPPRLQLLQLIASVDETHVWKLTDVEGRRQLRSATVGVG